MEISINAHNMKLTQRIETHTEKKTARLDRYMPNLREVTLDLSEENTKNSNERQVAQMTVVDKRGTILRAEERSGDILTAIDSVVDKMYKQIRRYRGKRKKQWRRNNQAEEFLGEPLPLFEEEEAAPEAKIVRIKEFAMFPMSQDEAIDQIELLGHDFFMFLNSEENSVNLLYRRRDGDYGLLKPVIG